MPLSFRALNPFARAGATLGLFAALLACGGGGNSDGGAGGGGDDDAGPPLMTQLAGSPYRSGNVDGPLEQARFGGNIGGIARSGGDIYVSDTSNHVVRKIAADGT